MTAPLGVIVPTRNSARTLAACLASITAQTTAPLELIVVDRGSSDDTVAIAEQHGARVLSAGPERSAQRNAGARASNADMVLFVDSDMVLQRDVVAAALAVADARTAVVIPERGFEDRLFTKLRSLEKRCYVGNDAVEAPRLYPREPFLALAGYDDTLSSGEDWDLADRWRRAGHGIRRADAWILHDDRSLTLRELLAKRFRYGELFVAYASKDGAAARAHLGPGRFLRGRRVLAANPVLAAGLIAMKGLEAGAFAAGLAARRARRRAGTV